MKELLVLLLISGCAEKPLCICKFSKVFENTEIQYIECNVPYNYKESIPTYFTNCPRE